MCVMSLLDMSLLLLLLGIGAAAHHSVLESSCWEALGGVRSLLGAWAGRHQASLLLVLLSGSESESVPVMVGRFVAGGGFVVAVLAPVIVVLKVVVHVVVVFVALS